MEVYESNGYAIYLHPDLEALIEELTSKVEEIAIKMGDDYIDHPMTKYLFNLTDIIETTVPRDPDAKAFRLGKTLPKEFSSWRRVKKMGLPDRYRLFFRFQTTQPKAIIYAWINGQDTIRKAGSRKDVYKVFEKMLKSGNPPNSFEELLKVAVPYPKEDEEKDA